MRDHIDIVGILFLVYGGLQLFGALVTFLLLGGGGALLALAGLGGDEELIIVGGIYGAMGVFVSLFVALFGAVYLVVGQGIRRRAAWARVGGFVAGALALMNMPLGTLLGVYAFVTLLDEDVAAEFT
jgi:hypothetical protein